MNETGVDGSSQKGSATAFAYTHLQDGEHPKNQKPSQRNGWVHRFWIWEVLSILGATIALAAMIITLVLHQDKPLPKWPSAITINALIAVFSAILKACVVMPIAESISQLKWLWFQKARPLRHFEQWDLASRGLSPLESLRFGDSADSIFTGPWGSLLLILTLKGRDLAVFGALLMIVAMAADPFTQQIVQYYSCSTIVDGEISSIPFSNNYTDGTMGRPSGSPALDSQMQSALYVGLLDPPANVSAAITFDCRTGNCTFPSTEDGATFMSLSMHTRCSDISSNISYSVNKTRYDDGDSNVTVTYEFATLEGYDINLKNGSAYVMQTGVTYADGWPSKFLNKFAFLMTTTSHAIATGMNTSTQAFECEFFPAVTTYGANITNAVLVEHVLEIQPMDVWPVSFGTHSLLTVNKTIRGGEWHECQSDTNRSEENNLPILDLPMPTGPTDGSGASMEELTNKSSETSAYANWTVWWPQDCVYWLPYVSTQSLSVNLAEFLGNETLFMDPWTSRATGKLWSVNLWNNGSATLDSVQDAMRGLADSMTARWRMGDGISNIVGPARGTVWENQTCVHVKWAWLTLPAALVLLTIVFLLLTIVQTNMSKGLVWKSSMLAVLFNGLSEETRNSPRTVVSLQEMTAAADATTIQLRETSDGYRLVGIEKQHELRTVKENEMYDSSEYDPLEQRG